jgi:hypothetical protein
MKTTFLFSIAVLLTINTFAQGTTPGKTVTPSGNTTGTTTTTNTTPASDFQIDCFIFGGSLGLGPILSTNLVGSGFIGESTMELMIQSRHHRYGIGMSNTLMGTPENLGVLLFTLGKDNVNLHKYYFTYEWTLFRKSPINLGAGMKFGGFSVGNYPDTTKTPFFASVGPVIELGHPRFYLYVKPEIGYNSYNTRSWKKDIYVVANIGLRWKLMADADVPKK